MHITKDKLIKLYKKIQKQKKVSKISRDLFCKETKISKSLITKLFGSFTIFSKLAKDETVETSKPTSDYNFVPLGESYMYDYEKGMYSFDFNNIKNIEQTIIIPKQQIYAILQSYSSLVGHKSYSVGEIAKDHKLSPVVIKAILNALNKTHYDLPYTDEDLATKDSEEIIEECLSISDVQSKYLEAQQKKLEEEASLWRNQEHSVKSMVDVLLKNWQPPKYKIPTKPKKFTADETYVVTISDLHFGAGSHKEETYWSKKDWNTETTVKAIDKYIESIEEESKRRTFPKECVLISLGDILHSVSGYTDKHTQIEYDTKGALQFKAALDSLTKLISYLSTKFNKLSVNAVSGNHDSFADWVLFIALEKYFAKDKSISFKLPNTRWNSFMIGNNLVITEHGYSAYFKAKVPKAASAKESYIHRLITKELKDLAQQKIYPEHQYFMMGDRHHFSAQSFPCFEFIQLPTCVGGDLYADHLNLAGTRNKQCTFIFHNTEGLLSTTNHYIS